MPIDPVNPLGWGQKDPITSPQMNGIDQRLVRAVDGVQGGGYAGQLSFSNTKLVGTSSIDTLGSLVTKGLVQATAVLLGTTTIANLADGANVACSGLTASVFHLSTPSPTDVHITLTWSWVIAHALYIVSFDHSVMIFGRAALTWSGAGITHRFSGGADVDGQPTPRSCRDLWTGIAVSSNEILWTVTRGIA